MDPNGLVTIRGKGYLLATREGEDRTYRLSRVLAAEALAEPAQRPDRVDLDRAWQERGTRFRVGGDQVAVVARVNPARREELLGTALRRGRLHPLALRACRCSNPQGRRASPRLGSRCPCGHAASTRSASPYSSPIGPSSR